MNRLHPGIRSAIRACHPSRTGRSGLLREISSVNSRRPFAAITKMVGPLSTLKISTLDASRMGRISVSWPTETRPLRSGLNQASWSPSMRSSVATRKSHHYAFHVTAQSQSTVNAAGGASFTPTSVPVMSAIAAMANTPKVTAMNHFPRGIGEYRTSSRCHVPRGTCQSRARTRH